MIRIITDSVASVPADEAARRGIDVVTLYVNRNGAELVDATMDVDAFYADIYDMVDDIPTSSQPSQHELELAFERVAEAGDDVIGIFLSSKLSGTFEGALRAARSVRSNHLGFRCAIIDSRYCAAPELFAVLDAADARDAGATFDEVVDAALGAMTSTRYLFAPGSLAFLKAGGRIGGAAAFVGGLVKLCPLLTFKDGEAEAFAKIRTRRKALERVLATFQEDVAEHGLKRVLVQYIGDKAPAVAWAREAVEPLVGHAVEVRAVSPVIGTHVGPAIGFGYECLRKIRGMLTIDPRELVCEA